MHASVFSRLLALTGLLAACSPQQKAPETDSASNKPSPSEIATTQQPVAPAPSLPRPVGPELIVLPGQGLSALRFGATLPTVKRHLGRSCELQTEERCIFIHQAIELGLKDGVVSQIKVHRRGRPVPGDTEGRTFGTFHGKLDPQILLGLHQHVVEQEYGAPTKKENFELQGSVGLVARHEYPGLLLEYDRIENGNTVLAAFAIIPPTP